ncbi:MAG: DUF58 domain-containing protein [Anaerolineae bacterium]
MDQPGSRASVVSLGGRPGITRRGQALLLLLAFLFVQMLFTPSKVWYYLFLSFGLAAGLSYLWTLSLSRSVRVARHVRQTVVQVGERLTEDFALANASLWPVPWLEVRDYSALPDYSVGVSLGVGAQAEERWQAGGICRRRGLFSLGPWGVRTGDPFGLFEAKGDAPRFSELLVYPPVGSAPEVSLRHGESSGTGRHMRASLTQTVTSAGVRPYFRGDPPRYIHWPSSLHARQLMVKDFDVEPAGDMWIVADMSLAARAGSGDESTEEYMVLAAAALAARSLRRNQAVGLLAYGAARLYLPPAKGDSQYWRVMRELAMVRASGGWDISRVLESERWNIGRGCTVVVLASSASPNTIVGLEVLRRLGVASSVLLFDAVSFGGAGDTQAIARQLVDAGIPYSLIDRGHEFVPLSRKDRRRRRPVIVSERWGVKQGA